MKLLWTRTDDMRHGRGRPPSHHRIRAAHAKGRVLTFEHRVTGVETDWNHGLGEIITAHASTLPAANLTFSETVFTLTITCPYDFGGVVQTLAEIGLDMHTGSWRSTYAVSTRGCEENVVDELAAALGRDPVEFRRAALKTDRQRAVLDKVAEEGRWGRKLPGGFAQGIGFHDEYRSCAAYLVELDGRDPVNPRVTKATCAVDVGLPINPDTGFEPFAR